MLECVINVSEGRDGLVLRHLADVVAGSLLDLHADPDHNRAVFTLAGHDVEDAARALASAAVERLDLRCHDGVHPRLGVVDVVPFVPLEPLEPLEPLDMRAAGTGAAGLGEALEARNAFARWFGDQGVPCYLYGPELSLPEVRKRAWIDLPPVTGPSQAHLRAGACCVGARTYLVAYNLWLSKATLGQAKSIAREIRSPEVRSLGLDVGGRPQVSVNLIMPFSSGPAAVYDAVAARARIDRPELVGLVPAGVLAAIPSYRWPELGLSESATIEARLERLAGGKGPGGLSLG